MAVELTVLDVAMPEQLAADGAVGGLQRVKSGRVLAA
jgi:hypothetical protein